MRDTIAVITVGNKLYLMQGIDKLAWMHKGRIDRCYKWLTFNCYRYKLEWVK